MNWGLDWATPDTLSGLPQLPLLFISHFLSGILLCLLIFLPSAQKSWPNWNRTVTCVSVWMPYVCVCVWVCRVFVPSGMQGRGEYGECVLSCEVGVCQDNNNTAGCMITAHIHTNMRALPHPQNSKWVSCFVKMPTEVPLRRCHEKLTVLLINNTRE